MKLNEIIKQRRRKLRIKAGAFAKKINVHRNTLVSIERGDGQPNFKVLCDICHNLDIRILITPQGVTCVAGIEVNQVELNGRNDNELSKDFK